MTSDKRGKEKGASSRSSCHAAPKHKSLGTEFLEDNCPSYLLTWCFSANQGGAILRRRMNWYYRCNATVSKPSSFWGVAGSVFDSPNLPAIRKGPLTLRLSLQKAFARPRKIPHMREGSPRT